MNRSLSLHPLSLVVGVLFAGACFLSMGQVWPAGQHVLVGYGPDPRDMVQISGGTQYVVPAGKVFVLTGLGNSTTPPDGAFLLVNGVREVGTGLSGNASAGWATYSTVMPVPSGFAVSAGSTIQVCVANDCTRADARAWGYLAPQ